MTAVTETSPTPYQLLPRLTDDEYAALKADIAEHGIRVPIDVDETGTILDGHHRAWIAADLGVDCPQRVVAGLSDEDKRAHAIAVNVHRRNLTREQRRELVARLRSDGMSTRTIAKVVGVSQATAAREARESNDSPAVVVGSDGKTYPAARETVTVDATTGEIVVPGQTGSLQPMPDPYRPAQPHRRPLPDAFFDAVYELKKATERVARLADDDRFPRNAEQVASKHRSDLLHVAGTVSAVLSKFPQLTD